jgi:serine/threonine protein kinase
MATVYYGRRVGAGGFAHAVAIKELHPHLASKPEVVSMFLDEARLAARVAHTNVVSILDVVEHEGEVWAVMPYVEGESLSQLAKLDERRRVPIGVALAIVVDLLAGLQAAHTATDELGELLGIVHRDVSPQNLLVGTDGVARVLDFGVAKARGRLQETRDGQVKGKLAYMAPEQLGGDASASTDVYAAAIVLWELLAGRRLFQGASEMDLLSQVLLGATTAPSAHADVPRALDELVMRALSLEPVKRFDSAAAMSRALLETAAGTIASRAQVAAWVSDSAATAIATRRRLAVDMARKPESTMPPVRGVAVVRVEQTERMLPSVSSRPTTMSSASSKPRRRALMVTLALLVTIGLAATSKRFLASVPSGARVGAVEPSVAAASPVAAALPSATAGESAVAPSAAPPEPAVAVAPSSLRAPAKLQTAKPAPSPPTKPSAVAPTPPLADDCDPPFIVDASGVRHYKRPCIR